MQQIDSFWLIANLGTEIPVAYNLIILYSSNISTNQTWLCSVSSWSCRLCIKKVFDVRGERGRRGARFGQVLSGIWNGRCVNNNYQPRETDGFKVLVSCYQRSPTMERLDNGEWALRCVGVIIEITGTSQDFLYTRESNPRQEQGMLGGGWGKLGGGRGMFARSRSRVSQVWSRGGDWREMGRSWSPESRHTKLVPTSKGWQTHYCQVK